MAEIYRPGTEREKNYVSAVVYMGGEQRHAAAFVKMLCAELESRFEHYELVFVDDASRGGAEAEVRAALAAAAKKPAAVTIVHLSLKQGLEPAMNAGLDMAVGDFVWEFDTMQTPYPQELILQTYDTCLAGSDIVTAAPQKNRDVSARLFYKLFNGFSRGKYPLRTDAFRLLSRRAINRVRGMSSSVPYRKAAYAASGLKITTLEYKGSAGGSTEQLRFSRAADALALYTGLAARASIGISVVMLGLMLAAVVYTVCVWFIPSLQVAPGWTTVMLLLTGGFSGVFLILAVVLKYLALLLEMVFHKQRYLVESVEKLQ